MVQSATCDAISNKVVDTKCDLSPKQTFGSSSKDMGKKEPQKKDNKYGAWGPTFKNKDHFANLHHC